MKIRKTSKAGTKIDGRKSKMWIVQTMAAAAGTTGIPFAALKAAKGAGCAAFKSNGTVDCDELIRFLADRPKILEEAGAAVDKDVEEGLKLRASRVITETKLGKLQENLIEADLVKRTVSRYAVEMRTKLLALPRRLAQVLALETEAIRVEERLESEFREVLKNHATESWMQTECPHCHKKIE